MVVSAYAEPMVETYARPRFGAPREPKNLVNPGNRLVRVIDFVTADHVRALAFVTRRGAVLAALIMCSSVLLSVEARLAKTDAMLLLTVVAAMGALARVYLSWQRGEDPAHPPWSWPIIFWTALAGGILLKGPLILMFVGLAILMLGILDRNIA